MTRRTSGYKRLHGLTIEQRNAIDLLVTGVIDRIVAEEVGVSRVTVTRWRNYDPQFQAELNRRRQEVWTASVDRMRALLPRAFDAIEREMDQGEDSWRAAVALVRLAGLDRPVGAKPLAEAVIGASEVDAIVNAHARAARPDPLAELLNGAPLTDADRQEALDDLAERAARVAED